MVTKVSRDVRKSIKLDDQAIDIGPGGDTHQTADGPSVLYDSVALLLSPEGAELLKNEASARDFIANAFRTLQVHRLCRQCKVLGGGDRWRRELR